MALAGTLYVSVKPSLEGFAESLRTQLAAVNDDFTVRFRPEVDKAEAARQGEAAAGAFADAFRARLAAALRSLPEAKINADASPAEREIEVLRARLQALADKKIGVDISAEAAKAEIDDIQARLTKLSASSADIRVRTDAARAAAELAALNAEVDKTDGREVNIRTDLSLSRIGALSLAIAALGPALIPIGATALAAFGSLGVAAGDAALAIGSVAIAFQGVGAAIKAQDQLNLAIAEFGVNSTEAAAAAQKYQKALEGLPPAAREFVNFYDFNLRPIFTEIRNNAAAGLFPGLTAGLTTAMPTLQQFATIIGTVSRAVGDLAREAGTALNSPFWHQFFDFINATATPTIKGLGEAFGNFIQGIAGLVQALYQPVFVPLLKWFQDFAKTVSDFGTSAAAGTNGPFLSFIAYVKDAAPVVTEFLKALVDAVKHIVEAMAGQGLSTLSVLTQLLQTIAALPRPAIQAIIDLFIAYQGLKLVTGVAGDIQKVIGLLTGGDGIVGAIGKVRATGGLSGAMGIAVAAAGLGGLILLADTLLTDPTRGTGTGGVFVPGGPGGAGTGGTGLGGSSWVPRFREELHGLADAIKDPQGALDDMKRQFDELGGDGPHSLNQGPFMQWFRGLPGFFASIWTQTLGSNGTGLQNLLTTIAGGWGKITDWWDGPTGSVAFFGAWKPLWDGANQILGTAWDTITGTLQGKWGAITDWFNGNNGTSVFSTLWTGFWNGLVPILSDSWGRFSTTIQNAWGGIVDWFKGPEGGATFTGTWLDLWQGMQPILSAAWDRYTGVLQTAWGSITSWFKGPDGSSSFSTAWQGLWSGLQPVLSTAWQTYTSTISTWWSGIVSYFTGPSGAAAFLNPWAQLWTNASSTATTWTNTIATNITNWWGAVIGWANGGSGFPELVASWTSMWTSTSSTATTWTNTIATNITNWWGAVIGWANGGSGFAQLTASWTGLWRGLVSIASGWLPSLTGTIASGINGAIGVINGLIGGANAVLGALNVPLRISPIPSVSAPSISSSFPVTGFAAGGTIGSGFVTDGPVAIVGEGNPNYPEYVIPTDPVYRPRAVALYESLGADLKAEGGILSDPSIPKMANGGLVGSLASWISGGFSSLISSAASQITSLAPGPIGQIGSAIMAKIVTGLGTAIQNAWNAIQAAIAAAAAAAASVLSGTAVSGASGNNMAIVQQTAAQFGWGSGAEWAALVSVIMRESGFRNTAQNPTSTAYGMFQFLDSTWAAYGIPKTSDPALQALAGMRYIASRYGDPLHALAHEQTFGWYDDGGMAYRQGLIPKLTNDPERVLSPRQTMDFNRLVHWLTESRARSGLDVDPRQLELGYGPELLNEVRDLNKTLRRRGAAGNFVINDQSGDPAEVARNVVYQLRMRY